MKKIIGMLLIAGSGAAFGSSFTGTILVVRTNTDTNGSPRVSLMVGNHNTPCGPNNATWYAYDTADTGIGKIWTAAAMAAYTNGRTVTILGTGTCDTQNVEIVGDIDLQ